MYLRSLQASRSARWHHVPDHLCGAQLIVPSRSMVLRLPAGDVGPVSRMADSPIADLRFVGEFRGRIKVLFESRMLLENADQLRLLFARESLECEQRDDRMATFGPCKCICRRNQNHPSNDHHLEKVLSFHTRSMLIPLVPDQPRDTREWLLFVTEPKVETSRVS